MKKTKRNKIVFSSKIGFAFVLTALVFITAYADVKKCIQDCEVRYNECIEKISGKYKEFMELCNTDPQPILCRRAVERWYGEAEKECKRRKKICIKKCKNE